MESKPIIFPDWDEDGDDDEYYEHDDDPDDCYFV